MVFVRRVHRLYYRRDCFTTPLFPFYTTPIDLKHDVPILILSPILLTTPVVLPG